MGVLENVRRLTDKPAETTFDPAQMRYPPSKTPFVDLRLPARLALAALFFAGNAQANYADDIGLTALRAELGAAMPTGAGIGVSQIEASVSTGLSYMPDATSTEFTGKTLTAKSGASTISGHANTVASYFYGRFSSLAPDVTTVDVYDASAWIYNGFLRTGSLTTPASETRAIQNHSWIGMLLNANNTENVASEIEALRRLDYVIQQNDVLACVGLNNGSGSGIPPLLASAYNVIAVGLTDGNHSSGTATIDPITVGDPGRVKPELVAPMPATSFATPLVSSAGAILKQAAPTAGKHSVSLKALLLAGATKDQFTNWHRSSTRPLDAHFGAGQLNISESYHILAAGQQAASASVSVAKRGWDYNTAAASARQYFFNIPATDGASRFSAALTWNRAITNTISGSIWGNPTATLANLSLRIYDATGFTKGALLDESVSTVDNVEHLYQTSLPAGRYLVEVTSSQTGIAYGLAWNSASLVTVSATAAEASERGNVPGTFTITRSGDLTNPLTVPVTFSGTAGAGADYPTPASAVTIPANQTSATISITPLIDLRAEGDETVTVTLASGFASTFANANATVVIHDQPIDAWRFSHFTAAELTDTNVSGDLADLDRDGIANVVEYALGLDPKIANANALPTAIINASGVPELTYTKAAGVVDISYTVEVSTNLVNWNPVSAVPSARALAPVTATETVTVSSPANISAEPIQFMRLRVTRQ